jgi:hypothetical protein
VLQLVQPVLAGERRKELLRRLHRGWNRDHAGIVAPGSGEALVGTPTATSVQHATAGHQSFVSHSSASFRVRNMPMGSPGNACRSGQVRTQPAVFVWREFLFQRK